METLTQAFSKDEVLYQRILAAINLTPQHRPLFEDIAVYHLYHSRSHPPEEAAADGEEPAAKKRKLANGSLPLQATYPSIPDPDALGTTIFELKDVSFSIPTRKKLHFRITSGGTGESEYNFYAINPTNGTVDYGLSTRSLEHVLRLPLPEKAQKQYNYVFLPKHETGLDPMMFTLPAGPLKVYDKPVHIASHAVNEEHNILFAVLGVAGISVVEPRSEEFSCATPESHRRGEKAYHVKAYRGGKDGFLFWLEKGIFFGFKKPLWWVGSEQVESISYTSVLQRTFNVVVSYRESIVGLTSGGEGEGELKEVEFSMLDQADYAGINAYVQKHGLNDASLAEGRRAKMLGKGKKGEVNGASSKTGENGGEEEDDGRTELEKAEAQLQDEEDEMEEDFEPESDDGDSDGSEDEDDDNGEGEGEKDLLQEELGSEAEAVSDDEEDAGEDEDAEEDDDGDEEEVVEEVQEVRPPVKKAAVSLPSRKANDPDPDDDDQL